jgi:hypothetical protein
MSRFPILFWPERRNLLLSGNTFFLLQKKFNGLWFSFADLLESARRLDYTSRTDLWCGF